MSPTSGGGSGVVQSEIATLNQLDQPAVAT